MIRSPAGADRVERLANLIQRARGEPRCQFRFNRLPEGIALLFFREVHAFLRRQRGEPFFEAGGLHQGRPMSGREGGDHNTATVRRQEITTKRTEDMIARRGAIRAVDLCFRDISQVAQHGEGRVGERDTDVLTLARVAAMAIGNEHGIRRRQRSHHVPDRHHVIDGTFRPNRPGDEREASAGIDRVVERHGAVAAADDIDHDQIVSHGF